MVSQLIRTAGYSSTKIARGKRNVLTHSTGQDYVVIADPNDAAGTGDDSGIVKFYIYQTDGDPYSETWTLRATVTPTVGPTANNPHVTANLFSDNSIGLAWCASDGTVRYRKVTVTTWAISAEETCWAAVAGTFWRDIDIDVNDQGAVLIAGVYTTSTNGNYAGYRIGIRTTAGTWGTVVTTTLHPNNPLKTWCWDVTCCWIGGATSGARTFSFAYSTTTDGLADYGSRLWVGKISETAVGGITGLTQVGSAFGIDEIKIGSVNTYAYKPRETYVWKDEVTNSVTVASINNSGQIQMWLGRFTYDGTTVAITVPFTRQVSNIQPSQPAGVACTYGSWGAVNYLFAGFENGQSKIMNFIRQIDTVTGKLTNGTVHKWVADTTDDGRTLRILGGTGRNAKIIAARDHRMVYVVGLNSVITSTQVRMQQVQTTDPDMTTRNIYPPDGAVLTDATPMFQVEPVLLGNPPQSRGSMFLMIGNDPTFSLYYFYVDDSENWQPMGSESTVIPLIPGSTAKVMQVQLSDADALSSGPWYWTCLTGDEFGSGGGDSDVTMFTIAHPPSAYNLTPDNGQVIAFGSGAILFKWTFSDPWVNDTQSAYQVQVYNPTTATTIYDSGKITTSAAQHSQTMVIGDTEKLLQWRVKVYDTDDTASAWTEYEDFYLAVGPTVTADEPDPNDTVTQPNPVITAIVDTSGGRQITAWRISITQGSTTIHNTGWVTSALNDGATLSYAPSIEKLKLVNLQNYTLRIEVRDSLNLGASLTLPFSTTWTPPNTPGSQSFSTASYNTINQGYNRISWTDASRDADFIQYNIYRKSDFINQTTLAVLEAGAWELIGTSYDLLTSYVFDDYYAPSGYKVSYQITQVADRFGVPAESTLTSGTALYPQSDGYWLIDPNAPATDATAFRLSIVTSDSFTDEYEEETYHILGRGRYVEKGDRLGYSGTLSAQIRDDVNYSARQKRKRLETIRAENREMYLRNPFGDMFRVSVGNMSIDRIAGVGLSEFVDVSIPYQEVGE